MWTFSMKVIFYIYKHHVGHPIEMISGTWDNPLDWILAAS